MATRVQVILDEEEREVFRRAARQAGTSLSAWLRDAGHRRLDQDEKPGRIESLAELDAFFAECDRHAGRGREPDWERHLDVIDSSRRSGSAAT
jgi:hypothetical protein